MYMIFAVAMVVGGFANAQGPAFYNAGTVTIEGTGLLYVNGDVEIAGTGAVTNNGTIEIKGNYTNERTDGAISNGVSGERVVRFTGVGDLQVIDAPNATSAAFYKLETNNQVIYIAGAPAAGVAANKNVVVNGELIFNNGGIAMEDKDLILGLNATASGYANTNSAHFTSGSFVKKIASGQPSTEHVFPYFKRNYTWSPAGAYLPTTIRLNTAPVQADEIRVKFVEAADLGSIFHVGGCSTIGGQSYPNQNIMLNHMVENFGYWQVDAEDAADNNLDNVSGWNYDITLHPTLDAVTAMSTLHGSDYYKLIRIPSHSGNTLLPAPGPGTDWSNHVAESGTYCNGIVVINQYNQSTGIKATQLSKFSRFGGAGNEGGASLPIELLSLDAVPVDNQHINVKWSTAVEIDNKGFEVLRSTDGENFQNIGWVDGNGNATTQHNYSLMDRNVTPNTLYYYRLNQVDNDGNSELTHVVSAMVTSSTVFTISDFIPNPTHSSTRIEITSGDVKHVSVTIYNTLGQIISQQEIDTQIGTTPINFDMTEVAAGTYYGVIMVDGEEFNKKLVIARQ